ncbi:uncharacterized protein LOC114273081 [Camellia sinensis]|uniref:uncharacterized protein LOC114273081 n=1 Tax=Camellia sinensis TaxID=4442 RepID=UPI001035D5DE|nr:uncharacterized protein LOC114273081 [Camellia sinensis]
MRSSCKKKNKNKKKWIAFKSTSKSQEEEEDASEKDEEMAFITKRFKRFVKKKQELKKQFKKDKKKAMIAAWGEDSDDSDSETDICKNKVANLYLIALEDDVCFRLKSSNNRWYLDSACSRHMTGDKAMFSTLKSKEGGHVTFFFGKGKIIGEGSIGKPSSPIIENVLLVAGLKHNLLSIS